MFSVNYKILYKTFGTYIINFVKLTKLNFV